MSVINLKSITPEHVFDIELTIDDGDANEYTYKMLKLHPFEYGNDEDIDTIIYPSNVKIEFTCAASDVPLHFGGGTYGEYRNFDKEYFSLINKFSFYDTAAIIYKDGVEEFRGFVDQKNKGGSFENKSFELTILSDFNKLKDIDPRTLDPEELLTLPEEESGNTVLFIDAIKETIKLAIPTFDTVVLISDIKSQTDFYPADPWIAPASRFGCYSDRLWGGYTNYTNCIDLIKGICTILGCLSIYKNGVFYLISRWFKSDEEPVSLLSREFVSNSGPVPYYSKRMEGLHMEIAGNPALPSPQIHEYNYGNVEMLGDEILNDDNVEIIEMPIIGGTSPGSPPEIENFWILTTEEYGDPQWINSVLDSCYGGIIAYADRTALWDVIGSNIWELIQYNRLVYQLDVKGTDWQYDKFYSFEHGLDETFRARKIKYDYTTKSTNLDLIKC